MKDCPDDQRLCLYLDRELPAGEAARIDAHRAACPRCDREISVMEELEGLLRPGAADAPRPELLARIRSIPDRRRGLRAPLRLAAVAAAAAAVLAALLLDPRHPDSERPGEPPSLREQVFEALVRSDPGSRRFLDGLGDSALVVLQRIAGGESSDAARAAIDRLGDLGRRESLPALIEATRRLDRRESAVRALAKLGDRRALPAMEAMIEDGEVEHFVLPAVARLGGRQAVRILGERIVAARRRPEAPQFVLLLAEIGSEDAARELLPLLADPEIAPYAARALSMHRERLLPRIHRLARSGDLAVAGAAITVLGRLRAPESVPVLDQLLRDRRLRYDAACALGRIDTAEAADALIACLRYPEVRAAFDRAGPAAEERLIVRLYEKSLSVRQTAVELLGLCGGPRAVRALVPLAKDPRLAPRALQAIGSIGGEEAVAALNGLADTPRLRREALMALAATGHPAAARALAERGIETTRPGGGDPALQALATMDPNLVAPVLLDLARETGGERAQRILAALCPAPRPNVRPWSGLD